MCPTFDCNLTVQFTFDCCSKYSGINGKLIYIFYCNFYIGLYMANTCKVYTFYMCPGSTVISLYIFAVWHKPNKGKKRDHNMFGIICYPPTSIPYCSLILNTIILNFFSAGIIMVWYHLGCGVSINVAPKSKFFSAYHL